MARQSDIWWRESRQRYYTTINGRQKQLGRTLEESERILKTLLKEASPPEPKSLKLSALFEKFLSYSQQTNEPDTVEVHRLYLNNFLAYLGDKVVAKLCEADLDEWCRMQAQGLGEVPQGGRAKDRVRKARPWSENTQVRAKAIVLAALNFGTKKLAMGHHPLEHVVPGSVTSRETYLSSEQRALIKQFAIDHYFRDYLEVLESTGARPFSEICKVTAADVDLTKGLWTMKKWKNAKKKRASHGGKDALRTIYISESALLIISRLHAKYPEGPIFRNRNGRPWTRQALTARFRRLSERSGISVTAYTYRHCFITDALSRKVPVALVAQLCGTSIATIQKHYMHLDRKEDQLREALSQALGES